MLYVVEITTPANTPIATPALTVQKVNAGILKGLKIYFPAGPCWLAGVSIWQQDIQWYPRERYTWFTGEHVLLEYDVELNIASDYAILELKTYNIDDTYEHSVQIHFDIADSIAQLASINQGAATQELAANVGELNTTLTSAKQENVNIVQNFLNRFGRKTDADKV